MTPTTNTNTGEENVADGGTEQPNTDDVDVHAFDINPLELDYEDGEWARVSDTMQNNKYKLREIKGSDGVYVAYYTYQTPADEEDGYGLLGIGRLSLNPPELDVENIEKYLRDEVENAREEALINRDVILDNAAEIAESLKAYWEDSAEGVINNTITSSDSNPGFDGSSVYTTNHNALYIESDTVIDEYEAGDEGSMIARKALEREVTNHTNDQWGDVDYFAEVELEIEEWELRALELQQNAGFPRRMSEVVAVSEEESMKRDVADRLDISSSTVTEHLQNAAERVEEARWTLRNVDL